MNAWNCVSNCEIDSMYVCVCVCVSVCLVSQTVTECSYRAAQIKLVEYAN